PCHQPVGIGGRVPLNAQNDRPIDSKPFGDYPVTRDICAPKANHPRWYTTCITTPHANTSASRGPCIWCSLGGADRRAPAGHGEQCQGRITVAKILAYSEDDRKKLASGGSKRGVVVR